MSININAEIVINRSKDDVASFAMDPDNDPTWISGIVEAKTLTDPPFGKGTKVQRVAKFLGRRMEYTPEVIEYDPMGGLVMRTDKPFDMTIRYQFKETDGGTLAGINIQGEGTGFYNLAAPLLSRAVKRNITRDLKTLKKLLESGAEKS